MKRKVLSVLLVAASVVTLAAGCGGNETNVQTSSEDGELQGEIKVYAWTQMATALSDTAERFMEENPGVTVNVEQVDGSYTKLLPELASGVGVPDVFMVQNTDILSFVKTYEGQIMDVSDIITSEEDNFVDSAIAACRASDGKYYAVPIDIGPCGLMYRTDIFEEYGINVEDIKTWDDYIEAGKQILEASDGEMRMSGFNFNGSTSQDFIKMLFAQQGGSYYNDDGTVNLTSEEMLTAAEKLKEMVDAGIMMDFPDEWNDRITALNESQICTLPYAVWYGIVMKDSVADQAGLWGVAPMPSFDGESGSVSLGGSVLAISENTEYPEVAKEFVKFSLMDAAQADIMYAQSQYQAYKPYWEAECYKETDEYFGVPMGEVFSQWTDAPEMNFGEYFTDITDALSTAIGEIYINNANPADALKTAEETAQAAIDNK